jgi:hypothetical protein
VVSAWKKPITRDDPMAFEVEEGAEENASSWF